MKKTVILLFMVFFIPIAFLANLTIGPYFFHPPLHLPLILSGSYGEIRTNHFHSGIDIKTGGMEGQPVLSIEDGYISRIKVSSVGFGKALYINHPGGYTSVYAHLRLFDNAVAEYVFEEQYRRKSFDIDLYPNKDQFLFSKGDTIASSGNTGGSFGPHLHFEIRDSRTEHPLNPAKFNFNISDNTKPIIRGLFIYPVTPGGNYEGHEKNSRGFAVNGNLGNFRVSNTIFTSDSIVGFGLDTYDQPDNALNKNGINSICMVSGKDTLYSFTIDEFDFSQTRYINSHIDYYRRVETGKKIHKCFKVPNNKLNFYGGMKNDGLLVLNEGEVRSLSFFVADSHGNTSILVVKLVYTKGPERSSVKSVTDSSCVHFNYARENIFRKDNIEITFPLDAFYYSFCFQYSKSESIRYPYSGVINLHDKYMPVQSRYRIRIKPVQLQNGYRKSAAIYSLDAKDNPIDFEGGYWDGEYLTAKTRQFGKFAIILDTVPPTISPLNIYNGKNLIAQNTIRIKVDDSLAGISDFEAMIDGRWILMDYDQKKKLIVHEFGNDSDNKYGDNPVERLFSLMVTDKAGNTASYNARIIK